jgi:hypothetical protein
MSLRIWAKGVVTNDRLEEFMQRVRHYQEALPRGQDHPLRYVITSPAPGTLLHTFSTDGEYDGDYYDELTDFLRPLVRKAIVVVEDYEDISRYAVGLDNGVTIILTAAWSYGEGRLFEATELLPKNKAAEESS